MLHSTLRTLLGLAVGDAYGIHFEFMSAEDISKMYMKPPQRSLGEGIFKFEAGDFSDDTEMALLTLYSLMHNLGVNTKHLKQLYTLWVYHAKDIGIQTKKALLEDEFDASGEGNGALMRILPCVVYLHEVLGQNNARIKESIRTISAITHDNTTVHAINDFFIDVILHNDLSSHQKTIEDFSKTDGNSGWVMNTARIVYQALCHKKQSLMNGLWEIIQKGGDTDTACAIYAAIKSYHTPSIIANMYISLFLNQKSQKSLEIFFKTQLHYYQPDQQKMPTLFAGQYPGSKSPSLHAIKLTQLLSLKIDCVMSLMEEAESSRFTRYQEALYHFNPNIEYFNYPIPDMSVPTKKQLYDIVHHVQTLLTSKKRVYIHCWGGHGRTGVVVGALLIYNGYTPQNALAKIKEERMKTLFGDEPSLQTDEQIKFVLDITQTARVEQDVHQ